MVVLSASVCNRQGKAYVSRQYVEMNRLRVEGLLAAFPKLIGIQQQHTYVETDSVRYVYQPLENSMYLLLITTKASNIVEDLGTLRLLAKVIPDVAGGLQEQAIAEKAFELIFAFDEVITSGGYKEEDCTLSSIRNNLEMDSHEEKVHLALMDAKKKEAQAKADKVAADIRKQKMAHMQQNIISGGTAGPRLGGMEGFGGGGMPATNGFADAFNPQSQFNNGNAPGGFNDSPYAHLAAPAPVPEGPKVIAKGGMKLGGGGGGGLSMGGLGGKSSLGGGGNKFMAQMAQEENIDLGSAFDLSAKKKPAAPPSTPLTLALEEKITVNMNREGAVDSCEVKGTLTLTANTDVGAMAAITVNKNALPGNFSYATHPKVDKKSYSQGGVLTIKGGKGFPVGRGVGVLRWSYNGEDAAPITINCWPEDEGGTMNVNIEMELTRTDLVLQDVNILLPLGTSDPPAIENIDGVYKHDPASGMLCWHFDQVGGGQNTSGSLEFTVAGNNPDAFFPVQVGFRSETLLCPIVITNVVHAENGTQIPNQMTKVFAPDSYKCA
mmetsp:Transcript_7083/g.14486  ORF Transcript_7083/g.14486 Transcript_7083/m.14486 type:complete len:550 (-) Transcript_7083:32-1681(-)